MSENWQGDLALKVRELLNKATWVQSAYCVPGEGAPDCYCFLGAVIKAMAPNLELHEQDRPPLDLEDTAADFIVEACPQFEQLVVGEFKAQPIIDWNDNSKRTWDEIDAVVDRLVAHYAMEGRA